MWTNHSVPGADTTQKLGGPGYHAESGSPGSLAAKLATKPGVHNSGALAAAIERRIHGMVGARNGGK